MEWTPHVVKMSNDISRNLSWFILCQSRCLFLCFDYVFCDGCQVSAVSSAAATDNIDFTILIWPLPAPNISHDLPILHRVPTVKLSAFIKFLMTFLGSIAYSEHENNHPTYIKHVLTKDRFISCLSGDVSARPKAGSSQKYAQTKMGVSIRWHSKLEANPHKRRPILQWNSAKDCGSGTLGT